MITPENKASIRYTNGAELCGLSTDEKPTNIGVNSLFLELDTGNFYFFTGEEWKKVGYAAESANEEA